MLLHPSRANLWRETPRRKNKRVKGPTSIHEVCHENCKIPSGKVFQEKKPSARRYAPKPTNDILHEKSDERYWSYSVLNDNRDWYSLRCSFDAAFLFTIGPDEPRIQNHVHIVFTTSSVIDRLHPPPNLKTFTPKVNFVARTFHLFFPSPKSDDVPGQAATRFHHVLASTVSLRSMPKQFLCCLPSQHFYLRPC